jgi:hypothetical protein
MALSDEEKAQLKKLTEKAKAPDTPPPSVNYNLDLSDDKAYERAVKLGLISGDDSDDSDGDEDEGDDTPKRKGYFSE